MRVITQRESVATYIKSYLKFQISRFILINISCHISLRWYAGYKNLFSCFKVTSSLTTQSQKKFGKKCDANFIVYLMFNLPRCRNSWTDLYRQHMAEKQRFLAFH